MNPTTFQAGIESWHDFYLAVGSASAALLGLLFVAWGLPVLETEENHRTG